MRPHLIILPELLVQEEDVARGPFVKMHEDAFEEDEDGNEDCYTTDRIKGARHQVNFDGASSHFPLSCLAEVAAGAGFNGKLVK